MNGSPIHFYFLFISKGKLSQSSAACNFVVFHSNHLAFSEILLLLGFRPANFRETGKMAHGRVNSQSIYYKNSIAFNEKPMALLLN